MLFYTIGLPGAGKTTFARNFSHWLGVPHLRGDTIGLELFRFPTYSPEERAAVFAEMSRRAAEQLRARRHVVYDAAVNSAAQRQQLRELAQEHGAVALGVWVNTPAELSKKRAGMLRDAGLAGRVARIIPPHIFDHYAATFESPGHEHNIIEITGDHPFALQYRRLQRRLYGSNLRTPRLIQ